MKRIILVALALLIIVGIAYAAADYLTSDPTIRKAMAYGDNSGTPTQLKCDSNGVLEIN